VAAAASATAKGKAIAAATAATDLAKSGDDGDGDDDDDDDDSEREFDVLDESGNWSPLVRDDEEEEDSCEGGDRMRRRRRRRRDEPEPLEFEDEDEDEDESHDESHAEVSLEDLKRKILGRSIPSHDADDEARVFSATATASAGLVWNSSSFADGATLASHLRQDLTCPICHDRFYDPVSLPCGHSFCRTCWTWWTRRRRPPDADVPVEVEEDEDDVDRDATCPSCRAPVRTPFLRVNTALKACMNALYGAEMNQRRLAEERRKRRATAGERGGAHGRGNVVLVPLPEHDDEDDADGGWISISNAASAYGVAGVPISVRRNVVLDDADQCRQLAMAFVKCAVLSEVVIDVELCLLSMEEDEIEDSGFPTIVSDNFIDKAFVCTGSDRVHSCIEATAVVIVSTAASTASRVKEVALSRGMIGRDGSVRFRFDLDRVLRNARTDDDDIDEEDGRTRRRVGKLKFRHVDTGAVLEMRPPSRRDSDSRCERGLGLEDHEKEQEEEEEYEEEEYEQEEEEEYEKECQEECSNNRKRKSRSDPSRFLLENDEEEEQDEDDGDHANAYQEDDFLVGDDHESEEDMDVHDEHDECHICNQGGDLIVCDGGDHQGGCGHAYHIECIHRTEVPPGDWICNNCAANIGMDHVGIEGYEWKDNESGETTDHVDEEQSTGSNHVADTIHADHEDDDSEEEIRVQTRKRPKRNVFDVDDSDDDSNFP